MTLWAEFTEVLRLPLAEDDFVHTVPWDRTGFVPDLPLVDIGAGAGHGTVALADAFPTSEVIAVEPDPSVRALLMLRIAERERLRPRVTVLPDDILDAPLPARLGGVVLLSVIYLLDGDQRHRLWDLLADHLEPGAPVLLNRSYGPRPSEPVPAKRISFAEMGRQCYERWFESTPGSGGVEICNIYRAYLDGSLVREERETDTVPGYEEEAVLAEVPTDFEVEEVDERFLVIRRG